MAISIWHPTDRANFTQMNVGDLTVWYSYSTPIAFLTGDMLDPILSENLWSNTTGKHLNYVSTDKTLRQPRVAFEAALNVALADRNL